MYRKSMHATTCSGVISASSFQRGLPSTLANRSQTAFTIAAVARWMTPFSGPSQRSWESVTSRRQKPPRSATRSLDAGADDVRRERFDGGDADFGPTSDREREAVSGEPARVVGLEHDIGGRVVGIRVHRVRSRAAARGRKANVVRDGSHDPGIPAGFRHRGSRSRFVGRRSAAPGGRRRPRRHRLRPPACAG